MPWYRLRSGALYHTTGQSPARATLVGDLPVADSAPEPDQGPVGAEPGPGGGGAP